MLNIMVDGGFEMWFAIGRLARLNVVMELDRDSMHNSQEEVI